MTFQPVIDSEPLRRTTDRHFARLVADCPEHCRADVLRAFRMTQFWLLELGNYELSGGDFKCVGCLRGAVIIDHNTAVNVLDARRNAEVFNRAWWSVRGRLIRQSEDLPPVLDVVHWYGKKDLLPRHKGIKIKPPGYKRMEFGRK